MEKIPLLLATEKRYFLNNDDDIVDIDNTRSYQFWARYLQVFNHVIVIARVSAKVVDRAPNVEGEGVSIFPLEDFQGLKETAITYRKTYLRIQQLLLNLNHAAILLRLPGTIGNIVASLCIKNNLKYSVELVGDPYEVFRAKDNLLFKALAYYQKIKLRNIIRNSSGVSYVTQYYLQNVYPCAGYQTHYSSIQLNRSFLQVKQQSSNSKLLLIGVGSLEFRYKGVDVLLHALKMLKDENIDFSLVWLGDGKLLSEYQGLANRLELDDKIKFEGSVDNALIPKYLAANNIFVMPSLSEGLPRALIEAMASSLICIGSNVGGIPELLSKTCLFEPGKSLSLFSKLKEVKTDYYYFLQTSHRNYEIAMEYLPEKLNERRIKFFKSINVNTLK
ncbi:glycosyltransferase family 4 protein [Chryseobacterium salipaludis]|uniref:glycosyltransferase family 4 protein n=1 Tax=Chryseobacterium TaxID=59732 RepID=UPI001FF5F4E0|nr:MULTISPECIES: glycosyltransferase [Chryseobacterium]MCJ8498596.1 glycosyltransferase family 4 protein [Chryseobacterium salipaludis]MCX3297754.1 glycosyltransferase [Planobacterium sp. JC490]